MPDLDFGETDEEAILVLKGFANRVNIDLYNHGTKGLLTSFNTWTTRHDARDATLKEQQDDHHRENSFKINLLIALATLGLLIVAAASLYVSMQVTKHGKLDPKQIFNSQSVDPMVSFKRNSTDSMLPNVR